MDSRSGRQPLQRGFRVLPILFVVSLAAMLSGCDSDGDEPLLVSAAASLSSVFADLAAAFEDEHPGVAVNLNVAGTSALREQILGGAPVAVFAPADTETMDDVLSAIGSQVAPVSFAGNSLALAVPSGNPAQVTGLEDLADPNLFIGLCSEQVPCGAYANQLLAGAGVTPSVDSYEPDVRALALKIGLGELDAGIVYATDVLQSGGTIEQVPVTVVGPVDVSYPIVALDPNNVTAQRFVDFVLSERGVEILQRYGFLTP